MAAAPGGWEAPTKSASGGRAGRRGGGRRAAAAAAGGKQEKNKNRAVMWGKNWGAEKQHAQQHGHGTGRDKHRVKPNKSASGGRAGRRGGGRRAAAAGGKQEKHKKPRSDVGERWGSENDIPNRRDMGQGRTRDRMTKQKRERRPGGQARRRAAGDGGGRQAREEQELRSGVGKKWGQKNRHSQQGTWDRAGPGT